MGEPSLAVTATINLRGLRAGEHALVDPADPYISELLSASFLVPSGLEEPRFDDRQLPEAETTLPGLEDPPGEADSLSLDSA